VGLVLGKNSNTANAGIDAVGEGKIYDLELAPEGHRWFGAPSGQVQQPGATTSSQDQCQCILRQSTNKPRILLHIHFYTAPNFILKRLRYMDLT